MNPRHGQHTFYGSAKSKEWLEVLELGQNQISNTHGF